MQDNELVRILKQDACNNDADAKYKLAMLFAQGAHGLPENWKEAKRLFQSAARQGHEGARCFLRGTGPSNPVASWLYVRGFEPSPVATKMLKFLGRL